MNEIINWKIQIKKGYLELCILLLIHTHSRMYGFELLEKLEKNYGIELKEGTLYPMLNRMTNDKILTSVWETENVKGHPRKFYSLTEKGEIVLENMKTEFEKMFAIYKSMI